MSNNREIILAYNYMLKYLTKNKKIIKNNKILINLHDDLAEIKYYNKHVNDGNMSIIMDKIYDYIFTNVNLFKAIINFNPSICSRNNLIKYFHNRHRSSDYENLPMMSYTKYCKIEKTYFNYGMIAPCIYYIYKDEYDKFKKSYENLIHCNQEFAIDKCRNSNVTCILYYIAIIYERYNFVEKMLHDKSILCGMIVMLIDKEIYDTACMDFWRMIKKYPKTFILNTRFPETPKKVIADKMRVRDDIAERTEYISTFNCETVRIVTGFEFTVPKIFMI